MRARDGKVHPVHANAAPIVDADDAIAGAVLVLREAAAQRQAERAMREAYTELDERVVRRTAALELASAALRERNALLNAITTSTPDLIFAKDRDGRILMANPAWQKTFGAAQADRPGLDDNERLVLEAGETMILEEAVAERTFLASKSPLRDEQGRVIGLIGLATDITERKQAQRELEKLVVAEQRLRAEAERANRAKDEFLAIVSHELRSPLNALRGWSHLMATSRPLEQSLVERASKAIKRNVDHQTRLIDDLLDTSRIVSGKLTIERRAVNLVEIVLTALDAARPGAAAKEIDLRFTPDDANIAVVGDSGRLQQLASNLLSNAVKFTPERGSISVLLLKNADRVQLQVKDNGIGIAPEFLPHVFDRFTQADTSAARRAGGLGIGLALVRHIALLHGGQVRADSAGVGRGSTFTVELPAAPASAARPVPVPERSQAYEGALSGIRVWMLDDDADAHEVVALTLRQTGATVETSTSAGELAAQLERVLPDHGPDVFLVDLAMPGRRRVRGAAAHPLARDGERRRTLHPRHRAHRLHPGRAREAPRRRLLRPRRQAGRRRQARRRHPLRACRATPRRHARRVIRGQGHNSYGVEMRALVSGTLAAAAVTFVASLASRRATGSYASALNATSHFLWGDRAARKHEYSMKYTGVGFLANYGASVLWALVLRDPRTSQAPKSRARATRRRARFRHRLCSRLPRRAQALYARVRAAFAHEGAGRGLCLARGRPCPQGYGTAAPALHRTRVPVGRSSGSQPSGEHTSSSGLRSASTPRNSVTSRGDAHQHRGEGVGAEQRAAAAALDHRAVQRRAERSRRARCPRRRRARSRWRASPAGTPRSP